MLGYKRSFQERRVEDGGGWWRPQKGISIKVKQFKNNDPQPEAVKIIDILPSTVHNIIKRLIWRNLCV